MKHLSRLLILLQTDLFTAVTDKDHSDHGHNQVMNLKPSITTTHSLSQEIILNTKCYCNPPTKVLQGTCVPPA